MAIASIADFREDDSKSPPLARPCVGTPLGELSGCRRDGPGARLDDPFLGRRALRFENLAAAERFDSLIPTAKKNSGRTDLASQRSLNGKKILNIKQTLSYSSFPPPDATD